MQWHLPIATITTWIRTFKKLTSNDDDDDDNDNDNHYIYYIQIQRNKYTVVLYAGDMFDVIQNACITDKHYTVLYTYIVVLYAGYMVDVIHVMFIFSVSHQS